MTMIKLQLWLYNCRNACTISRYANAIHSHPDKKEMQVSYTNTHYLVELAKSNPTYYFSFTQHIDLTSTLK